MTTPSYSAVARSLHWLTLALIALSVGIVLTDRWFGERAHEAMVTLHRSLGVTIWAVTALRLAYRLANPPPPDIDLADWERRAARAVHYALYALLLLVPVLGWLDSEFAGQTVRLFFLAGLPHLLAPDHDGMMVAFAWHWISAYVLLALVGLHAAAALYHHYVRRDRVLRRMLGRVV